ncbi:MAG: PRTRC system protein A [Candidatus Competibacteraceae bacterium]|jgi:PRTRC genetic system protein A|nr:PRTRC system protein A [Candidatus Competibacteraceae bacterium]
MLDYLSDPRDRVLLNATPCLMAPRFGQLPPVAVGTHRFVAAASGLFVQARTRALAVTLKVADTIPLPYGDLQESVTLAGGRLPLALYARMRAAALAAVPLEWAAAVVYDHDAATYRLVEPVVESVSRGHIRYSTASLPDDDLVLDIHSHGHGQAYFSATDDVSDRKGGTYIACVLGCCGAASTVEVVTRLVVKGIFFPVPWTPWDSVSCSPERFPGLTTTEAHCLAHRQASQR